MAKTKLVWLCSIFLAGCATAPTEPIVDFSSPNVISYKYSAYGARPTVTAKVRDMAARHCQQFAKNAVYKGAEIPSPLSAVEIHSFTCEATKVEVSGELKTK